MSKVTNLGTLLCVFISLALTLSLSLHSNAAVEREDHGPLEEQLQLPVYQWLDSEKPVRAIVIAIHGMTLYSGLFDQSARYLAKEGFPVYAVDLRGFGRWWLNQKKDIDFKRSEEDVVSLSTALRKVYPNVPIFALGECLGGNVAIRIVCEQPQVFDGMILSSAAIKRKPFFTKHVIVQFPSEVAHPKRLRDITPYINHFVSSNASVTAEILNDPAVRKLLSSWEAILAEKELAGAMAYANEVPNTMPVLLLQGGKDKNLILKASSKFFRKLNAQDRTIRWFPDEGHVLLETSHNSPEVLKCISDWLTMHKHGTQTNPIELSKNN